MLLQLLNAKCTTMTLRKINCADVLVLLFEFVVSETVNAEVHSSVKGGGAGRAL
jgi:hypothetical protein